MGTWIAPFVRPFMPQRFRTTLNSYGSIPRPDGPPQAHAAGLDPDRVLILGTDAAAGWGVRSQDLALPGQLARALSGLTGRGADVDLLADARPVSLTAWAGQAPTGDLGEYDAVVIVGGVIDAAFLRPETQWTAHLRWLLDSLRSGLAARVPILVMGIPYLSALPLYAVTPGGLFDEWAARLNTATVTLCTALPDTFFIPSPPMPKAVRGRYRNADDYRQLALAPARTLAPLLDAEARNAASVSRDARHRPQDAARRVHAIDTLKLLDGTPAHPHPQIDDVVRRARTLFGTEGAAFTVVDRDRQWNISTVGLDATDIPLEESFCVTTIQHASPFVVEDSWTDPRGPVGTPYRFYAGHPVEAPDSTRIGTLCVFDQTPRTVEQLDLELLRDLALSIQRHLAS